MTIMPKRIDLSDSDISNEEINEGVLKSKSQGAFDGFINDSNSDMFQKGTNPTNRTYQNLIEEVKIPTWKIEDPRDISKAENNPRCKQCGQAGTKNEMGKFVCQNSECPYVGREIKAEKPEQIVQKSKMIKAPKEPKINNPPVKHLRKSLLERIDYTMKKYEKD